MNELDDLLQVIVVPPSDPAADLARGERALRRRRRTQVSAVAASVAACAAVGVALHGSTGSPGTAPQLAGTSHSPTAAAARHDAHQRQLALQQARRHARALAHARERQVLRSTLVGYRDVLVAHLDPGGARLSPVSGYQASSGPRGVSALGTKLDWDHGGMLELIVGHHWGDIGSFYLLDGAGMTDTTYDGHPARVSTTGSDVVVSVQHGDGTVVTLVASDSFGNNGTSISGTRLAEHDLLAAAADPRLRLPDGLSGDPGIEPLFR